MLLAVDTSTQTIGLAIYNGWQVVCESIWQSRNHHTVEVAPAMHELMQHSGIKPGALQALAVASGPGSFTSLRIGMALIKGMALALHLPVVSLPTLDILAAGQPAQDLPMAAVLQAGRGRLAVGWYHNNGETWESQGKA
ncbi:MAG TPA: tRNA (adenosine(37)-N6)-threonylcarbamoyltransferase complex dimerization subunit type 1 TsaB, partial [Anaerolineaceae bacterium]|nr:tRNA (adenosine(37)-N6)-threonylcarbamoyltransferase complex dimerization subunit type 1 TsaB [Anaerolineaceae bacterium]